MENAPQIALQPPITRGQALKKNAWRILWSSVVIGLIAGIVIVTCITVFWIRGTQGLSDEAISESVAMIPALIGMFAVVLFAPAALVVTIVQYLLSPGRRFRTIFWITLAITFVLAVAYILVFRLTTSE